MDLKINICTNNLCGLDILDNTEYPDKYKGGTQFSFSDSISIISIETKTTEKDEFYKTVFVAHTGDSDLINIPIDFDGWFKVTYIVVPTETWFQQIRTINPNIFRQYSGGLYYSDGNSIYRDSGVGPAEVTIDEIINLDSTIGTSISKCSEDYFSICNLKKCYINLCKQIFESGAFQKCSSKNKIDCDLTFKRDMLLMAISVIEYLIEFNQFAKAQEILERISSCNGLCSNFQNIKLRHGCGCGKKLFP